MQISQPRMFLFAIPIILPIIGAIWWVLHLRWSMTAPSPFDCHLKLPPGPRGLPIIGNLHMLGSLPHRAINELAKIYGPIMFMRLGYIPTIIVSSASAAELFLKTHDAVFANRPKTQSAQIVSYGAKGLATAPYGRYWRDIRKFCTVELLSTAKIDSFAEMRKEEIGLFVKSLKEAAAANLVVDVTEKVRVLIDGMTFRMLFGKCRDERFDLSGIIEELAATAATFNIADFVPFLRAVDLQGLTRRLKNASKAFDVILETIIDENQHSSSDIKNRSLGSNFVDTVLSLDKTSRGTSDQLSYMVDRTNMKAILADMILGTVDTSRTAIDWIISELIMHPRVMIRLQEELKVVVGDTNMVEEAHLSKLEYLNMVIKESLRLHPVAPLSVPRESLDEIVIEGYHIPKNSLIFINHWALGRDPTVWSKNAEEFFPERFIGSDIDIRGHNFQFIPFGSGRRRCPGMHLGLINIRLVVAQMVHCFDWKLPDGMSPSELQMDEKFGLTMLRRNHLLAVPIDRFTLNE